MERFNYPSIAAALSESAEILELLEAASYGVEADEKEKMEEQQEEIERQRQEAERASGR